MIEKQTLYIVGNGFDLHHWNGAKPDTSYQCFGNFLKNNDPDLHAFFSIFIPIEEYWHEFECLLAEMDMDNFEEYVHEKTLNYINDSDPHCFGEASWEAEKYVDLLTKNIRQHFSDFISGNAADRGGVKYPDQIDNLKLKLPEKAQYLSFNYTNTLERYYNIPSNNICYIHGKADNVDDLIMGHGIEPSKLEKKVAYPEMPDNLSPQQQEMWLDAMSSEYYSPSGEIRDHAISDYWRKSFKNTTAILQENLSFFDSCNGLEKVIVMGHSLSEVDLPYFEEVKKESVLMPYGRFRIIAMIRGYYTKTLF